MDLTDFQTVIQRLVKQATGYDDGHVIWQKQTRARPSRPFVGLDILDDETSFFTEDTTEDNPDATPPTFASCDLTNAQGFPVLFNPGAHVATSEPGTPGNAFRLLFDGQPWATYAPDPAAVEWSTPYLKVHVQAGVTTGAEIIQALFDFLLANPTAPFSVYGTGTTATFGVLATPVMLAFEGGSWGLDEVLLTAKEHVELNVQVIVYTSAVTGSGSASSVARKIRSFFARESTTTALGNTALVERAPVRDASIVLETEHEGRGVLALKFRVADLEVEATTYIETATVETTVEQTNGDAVYTLTITRE